MKREKNIRGIQAGFKVTVTANISIVSTRRSEIEMEIERNTDGNTEVGRKTSDAAQLAQCVGIINNIMIAIDTR